MERREFPIPVKVEYNQIVGYGLALMDEKVRSDTLVLPGFDELIPFLDAQKTESCVGGVLPNIFDAYYKTTPRKRFMPLFAKVGNDLRGNHFQQETHFPLQRSVEKPTGVVAAIVSSTGEITGAKGVYAAAEDATIDTRDLAYSPSLFVSDIFTLRLPQMFAQADKMFRFMDQNQGIFALNLGGTMTPRDTSEGIRKVLSALPKDPDILIGNEHELRYLTNQDPEEVFPHYHPNTRIAVLTQGAKGATIRFEGELIKVPPVPITVANEFGAGDAFCGAFLAELGNTPYNQLKRKHITEAGRTASLVGALVAQDSESRLTENAMRQLSKRVSEQALERVTNVYSWFYNG